MQKSTKIIILLSRLTLGWLMFYAGITKVLDPTWSAAGYLNNAKTLTGFFQWLAQPNILPFINFINEWGLTLLGVSLLLGAFVKLSSWLGVLLMLLYYLPASVFPYVDHGFLVDEHIIYILVLILFTNVKAGRIWGLDDWLAKLPLCQRWYKDKSLIG
ncbi:MAG: DoxX family membrane protein [bacterium]|nr:DoxX family membrane protein [bacterium]